MTSTLLIAALLLSVIVGIATYFVTRRKLRARIDTLSRELAKVQTDLSTAKTDFEARQQELRESISEARRREDEASSKAVQLENKYSEINSELKITLEQKASFQSEAARTEEIKNALTDRDDTIEKLSERLKTLELEKAGAVKDAEAANQRAREIVAQERAGRDQVIQAKNEQINKLNEFITQARAVLTTEFKALSADALEGATARLVQTAGGLIEEHEKKTAADVDLHKQEIKTMLTPVEQTIKRLDQHVADSNLARATAEALLKEQVERLAGASESLTNALRKPFVRGSWGEMTLENALENAGLTAEIDYVLQHYTDAEDGKQRTDAVINLPKGRRLVIDSKNLLESYLAIANAKDELEKVLLTETHSKSLKSHMKELSTREYWRRYEGLDCVILFIPHDGMYHAAIQNESELIRECSDKRVFISNPMTLMPLLKAVQYVLDQERLNKSAEQISKIGSELYAEVARFAENMANVGSKLRSTVNAYNEAIPGLDRFIVSKARGLKQLGAAKGDEPELPEPIDIEAREFSSRELRSPNLFLEASDASENAPSSG